MGASWFVLYVGSAHSAAREDHALVVRVCVANGTVDDLKLNRVYYKMSAQEAFEAWLRDWHARKAA